MSIRDQRRAAAIARMADHLLAHGLAGASLRPLAAAAGASDRMLLYYFADKDEILALTLRHVAERLAGLLEQGFAGAARRPYAALLADLHAAMTAPMAQPYLRLWFELVAGAAQGVQPQRAVAGDIAAFFHAWIADRLAAPAPARAAQAALLFATLEGLLLVGALGRPDLAQTALKATGRKTAGQGTSPKS